MTTIETNLFRGDKIKDTHLSYSASGGAQIPQRFMNEEVADFGENESEERQSGLEHVRRSVQRMIDQISDPRRETPVITVRQRGKKR